MAHFEIYILNYNGMPYLPDCLDHLRELKRGSHTLGVNVIDNGSTDLSEKLINECYPEVNFIPLGFNYGFSKGNNLGIAKRREQLQSINHGVDVQVLLNNDTAVEPDWLIAAAEVLERRKDAGIVGSKALFYDKFAPISIKAYDSYRPSSFGLLDPRLVSVFLQHELEGENIRTEMKRCKLSGAYPMENNGCWLMPESTVYVAVQDPEKPAHVCLRLENHHPVEEHVRIRLAVGNDGKPWEVTISRGQPQRVEIPLQPAQLERFVQNAGSFVTENWESGDRGFLEPDDGRFEQEEEVAAICGVSLFIRDELWQQLGGFDERYFAYYEDTDLSLRARLAGWKCVFAPQSRLRHVHCGSGVEHSEYFAKNVACSHMIFSSKMMNRSQWRKKKSHCRDLARREFQTFEQDRTLSHKPHLTAYCRYLKRYPYFAKNRFRNLFQNPQVKLKSFPAHCPDAA